MFALPLPRPGLRTALFLSLGFLCAGLLSALMLMSHQFNGVLAVPPETPRILSRSGPAAGEVWRKLDEAQKTDRLAMLRDLSELQMLLNLLSKPGSVGGPAPLVERMRQSADRAAALYGLRLEHEEKAAAELRETEELFHSAAAALRQKATLARERAVAEEAAAKFNELCLVGAAWQTDADRQAKTASLSFAQQASEPPVAPVPGRDNPVTPRRTTLLMGLSAGVTLAAGIAIVILALRGLSRPLAHLIEVARDVMHGRARRPASPVLAGDLRELAEAFNKMTESQQQAEDRLRIANESLELKVSARTAELARANRALKEEGKQRERAEKDFQQAQKMDALGKLAGSIAHDFNNLLTVIIGGAESVQKQLGRSHPAGALLETVQKAGERAAGLTRPLLTFSRSQVLEVEKVSLNAAAEEAAKMMNRLLGVNVDLRLDLEPNLPPVRTNPTQLQQVLINLGVNARDAMEGMGHLTIETRPAEPNERMFPKGESKMDRPWVELIVRDTGCGMDAETKARIFEPFFTTKPAGKGTGLGLATVFGIVKQAGGYMDVESAPGEGTAFHVFWPAMTPEECQSSLAEQETAPAAQLPSGGATVLLVDDETDIRDLAAMALEDHGYKVLTASHAEEALLLGEKHGREIRALITDVVMPGINGVQLAELLSSIVPDLKILFVSGHSNEAISGETLRTTRALFLQKPYRSDALLAKVGEALAIPPRSLRHTSPTRQASRERSGIQPETAGQWVENREPALGKR